VLTQLLQKDPAFAVGDFIAVFDPLDGSKNIDASFPVGTVFGIYRAPPATKIDKKSFLQNGNSLCAAGYCLYSATSVLVLTLGSGVDGFTLDPDLGQFLHTHQDIRIPSAGPIYSFNEANFVDFDEPIQQYLLALKSGSSAVGVR
jgi:fructose-1,6-bisphosphatase I